MDGVAKSKLRKLIAVALCAAVATPGCATVEPHKPVPWEGPQEAIPNEMDRVTLPEYVLEPPDILLIDAIRVVPKPPYYIEPLDLLLIQVQGALPEEPIAAAYRVDPSGNVQLGPSYGSINVAGLTTDDAAKKIYDQLLEVLRAPEVSVTLGEPAAKQQISGERLICPDGTVNLGTYGRVYVAGMTLDEAQRAIEERLAEFLEEPEVAIDVFSYNSKFYYIVVQGLGAGAGDNLLRLPVTGNETVLDAISQVNGLQPHSSKHVWIARPAPDCLGRDQILRVDWSAVSRGGATASNYQILPGDRLFIAENKTGAFGTFVQAALQPFENAFGFTLLGVQTVQTTNRLPTGLGGAGLGGGGFF